MNSKTNQSALIAGNADEEEARATGLRNRAEAAASNERDLEAFVAARSRFAEAEVAAAVERGVQQYVVLGHGLDSFAGSSAYPRSGAQVFDVDQTPASRGDGDEGVSFIFVPTDFEKESLSEALEKSEFKREKATLFSWLGATLYSTAESALATLRFIATMPRESGLLFDYAVERTSNSGFGQMALDALASRVAVAGETCRSILQPEALKNMLKVVGFGHVEDYGPQRRGERYFGGQPDDVGPAVCLAHLVSARV